MQRGLLPEDEGEGRCLLREEVLEAATWPGSIAVEEPQDLGVAVQLQVLQEERRGVILQTYLTGSPKMVHKT